MGWKSPFRLLQFSKHQRTPKPSDNILFKRVHFLETLSKSRNHETKITHFLKKPKSLLWSHFHRTYFSHFFWLSCTILTVLKWLLGWGPTSFTYLYACELTLVDMCIYFYHSLISFLPFLFPVVGFKRMEKMDLRSSSGLAKVLGTMVSISGAFVVTLCKGPPIIITRSSSLSLHPPISSLKSNWVIGGLLLTADHILLPLWYIVQVGFFLITQEPIFNIYIAWDVQIL